MRITFLSAASAPAAASRLAASNAAHKIKMRQPTRPQPGIVSLPKFAAWRLGSDLLQDKLSAAPRPRRSWASAGQCVRIRAGTRAKPANPATDKEKNRHSIATQKKWHLTLGWEQPAPTLTRAARRHGSLSAPSHLDYVAPGHPARPRRCHAGRHAREHLRS